MTTRKPNRAALSSQALSTLFCKVHRDRPDARQAAAFHFPGGPYSSQYRPRDEEVKALAQSRACRVARGGDVHVVTVVVRDEEMPVARLRERHLAQPLLRLCPFVPQLMCGADGDSADPPDRHHQAQLVDVCISIQPPSVHNQQASRQRHVLDRQVQVGGPAVERIALQPRQRAVGRILGVFAPTA